MNKKTAGDRLRYARQYASILSENIRNDTFGQLLQLPPHKRIHCMKALSCLARSTGNTEAWDKIRKTHGLTWSTGTETLDTFQRFFSDHTRSLDSMLQWVREAEKLLPPYMAAVIKFNCLTGLRPSEAIESVRLINSQANKYYYNPDTETLEHFRFPQIFIRRTKCTYISYLSLDDYQWIANLGCKTPPTYAAIRFRLERLGVKCHLGYCRKIFASWLIKEGIDSNTVHMLQGRCPSSVLARHYQCPDDRLRQRVLDAVERLKNEL